MKYFIIVVLICIAWKFSNGNVKDDYFLDYAQTSTVKREGDVIKVWTKTVPKEGKIKEWQSTYKNDKNHKKMALSIQLYKINCNTNRMSLLSLNIYDKNGNVVFSEDYSENKAGNNFNVPPNSGLYNLQQFVCETF